MKSFLLIPLFLFVLTANGQKLIFCESVSKSGVPLNISSYFSVVKKGGFLHVLVQLPRKIETRYVLFDIYRIDPATKKETLENSLRLETQPEWTWFSEQITFFHEGNYVVYVFNEKDQFLATGKVKIAFR